MLLKRVTIPKNPFIENSKDVNHELAVPIEIDDNLKGTDLTIAVILALNEKLKEAIKAETIIE